MNSGEYPQLVGNLPDIDVGSILTFYIRKTQSPSTQPFTV
ncbi:hypothetical protein Cflav_PD1524 [Pedosphaera parvula Ellin514]|uniref:Uncharacterized protein n=1 Tax=Pedosphaera parvula (strain Ellin514) TaxID=320771 RepID=B9XNG4_PEDPL|nr:hypothetical protein Cflav_PD1524 [Pedosphaera parvula Ellin514]